MAKQQPVARSRSSKRDKPQESVPDTSQNGREGEVAIDEKELARYLQQRLKPGLSGGAIPMLARSIAKQIARGGYAGGASGDAVEGVEQSAEDVEDTAEGQVPSEIEALHELQAKLGEDWIVRYCVQGEDEWLSAEKDDGSQYLEATTGSVLAEVVGLLKERGGRPA